MGGLIAASVAFVGLHFVLSHPLRPALARRLGEGPFLGVYSLVAGATLLWMILAYQGVPAQVPAYAVGDAAWAAATAVMWVASVLLVGSLIRNPALPDPTGKAVAPDRARGVYAITRHPMMWAFSLWALVHIAIWPTPANHVVATAILVLAVFGSLAQDRKKQRLMGDRWAGWEARTSWLPFAALATGKARWGDAVPGLGIIAGGTAMWLAATWAHIPLGAIAAGIWRWIG